MTDDYDSLEPIVPPRALLPHERALIDRLLQEAFAGSTEIRAQLALALVEAEGRGDTRTLRFTWGDEDVPRAQTAVRIPVEAEVLDNDGMPIAVLLHVIDGLAEELEIYRVDGEEIQQPALGTADSVMVNDE
jgi:hypothetical protein